MARVKVNLLNIFAIKTGKNRLEYNGEHIDEVISQFFSDYQNQINDIFKNKEDMKSRSLILLNGKNIALLDMQGKLSEGDEITISLPVTGG